MSGRRRGSHALLGCLGGLVAIAACDDLAEPTVLTVGSRVYTARDLREIHAGIDPAQRPPLGTPEQRLRFVDRVVERALLAEHGRSLTEGDPDGALERLRANALLRRLQTLEAGPDTPDSASVWQAYERMGTLHRVQGLVLASEDEGRRIAAEVSPERPLASLAEYRNGVTFDAWLSWSPTPDPVTEAIIEAEPGEVVGPIPSEGWWRLATVVARRPATLEPYPALRPRLLRGLRHRAEVQSVQALRDRLLESKSPTVHDAAVASIAEQTRRTILRAEGSEADADWAVPDLSGEPELVVAEWAGGRLDASDYVRTVRAMPHGQRPRSSGLAVAVRVVIREEVERRLLVAEAERRGLANDRWVVRRLDTDREDYFIEEAIARLEADRGDRATVDSLALALRDSQPHLFLQQASARVLRFDLPNRQAALRELAAIREAGGGAARLRQRLEGPGPPVGSYHVLEVLREGLSDPDMAAAVFDSEVGTVSGPYELVGSWVLVTCLERFPERPRDEVEIADLLGRVSASTDVVAEWLQARIAEVGVSVDEEVLAELRPGG